VIGIPSLLTEPSALASRTMVKQFCLALLARGPFCAPRKGIQEVFL
jgi:hypothetical protein